MESFFWSCEYCSKVLELQKKQQIGGHLTNCFLNPKRDLISGKISAAHAQTKFEHKINCKKCSKEFVLLLSQGKINSGNHKQYCSVFCYHSRYNGNTNAIVATKVHKENAAERVFKWQKEAESLYIEYKNDPLFILGVGLYWGEGSKISEGLQISNSDPNFLRVWVSWHKKFVLNVEMRVSVLAQADVDKEVALKFWQDELSLPVYKLYRSIPKSSLGKVPKRKLEYGTVQIVSCKGSKEYYIKMMKWIELVEKEYRSTSSIVESEIAILGVSERNRCAAPGVDKLSTLDNDNN